MTIETGAQNPANGLAETLGEKASATISEVKDAASTVKSDATDQATALRDEAAKQAGSVASALDQTADNLDPKLDWAAGPMKTVADQLGQFADTIDGASASELMQKAKGLSHQNPATFYGACAALGFAAGRLVSAAANQGTQPAPTNTFTTKTGATAFGSPPVHQPAGTKPTPTPTPTGTTGGYGNTESSYYE